MDNEATDYQHLLSFGLDVIPLKHNTKEPIGERWQLRSSDELWQAVSPSEPVNIGLRPGAGGIIGIDCDNRAAVRHVSEWLSCQGLPKLSVVTPSGNRHFYVRSDDAPPDLTFQHLNKEVGKGEMRVRNCYLVLPHSVYEGKVYRWEEGDASRFPSLPSVQWNDLKGLLPDVPTPASALLELPVRLLRYEMPPRTLEILLDLKANQCAGYPSFSEAEQAVVSGLFLAGWTFNEIEYTFEKWMPPHYRKRGRWRHSYLETSYNNALIDICRSKNRPQIASEYQAAQAQSWTGRGGQIAKETCLAMLAHRWKWGDTEATISKRDRELAIQAERSTIRRAIQRQFSKYAAPPSDPTASIPRTGDSRPSLKDINPCDLWGVTTGFKAAPHLQAVVSGKRIYFSEGARALFADRQGMLGRTAGALYEKLLLSDSPLTAVRLSMIFGFTEKTVREALKRLDADDLAQRVKGGWIAGSADVEIVAKAKGAHLLAQRRRDQVKEEREAYRQRRQQRRGSLLTRQVSGDQQMAELRKCGWSEERLERYTFPLTEENFGVLCDQAIREWRSSRSR